MSQTGYTPIQLYNSPTASSVPLAANLAAGELAINNNILDGKLYYKDTAGVVRLLASKTATSGIFPVIGVGTTSPDASAVLDAQSTTQGMRFPNMTTTQKNAVSTPAAGLVIFDTTLAKLCLFTGVAWQTITSV